MKPWWGLGFRDLGFRGLVFRGLELGFRGCSWRQRQNGGFVAGCPLECCLAPGLKPELKVNLSGYDWDSVGIMVPQRG